MIRKSSDFGKIWGFMKKNMTEYNNIVDLFILGPKKKQQPTIVVILHRKVVVYFGAKKNLVFRTKSC